MKILSSRTQLKLTAREGERQEARKKGFTLRHIAEYRAVTQKY